MVTETVNVPVKFQWYKVPVDECDCVISNNTRGLLYLTISKSVPEQTRPARYMATASTGILKVSDGNLYIKSTSFGHVTYTKLR